MHASPYNIYAEVPLIPGRTYERAEEPWRSLVLSPQGALGGKVLSEINFDKGLWPRV